MLPGDDLGREEHTGLESDRRAFRTPSLRNVELTAPYMHDGVFSSLDQVIRFYDAGASPRHAEVSTSELDPLVANPLGLSAEDRAALESLLRALTDPGNDIDPSLRTVPQSVPSGLTPVVGNHSP